MVLTADELVEVVEFMLTADLRSPREKLAMELMYAPATIQ
jgi:hypothetical protein